MNNIELSSIQVMGYDRAEMGSVVHMEDKITILEYDVQIPTKEVLVRSMKNFCEKEQLQSILFLSVDILEQAMASPEYREKIAEFQFMLPGETNILYMYSNEMLKKQGMLDGQHCIQLILEYLEAEEKTVFLVGDEIEKIEYFLNYCQEHYPKLDVVGTFIGDEKMDDENLLNEINVSCPDVILTAIAPQLQENWILSNVAKLNGRVCIGADVLVKEVVQQYVEEMERENYNLLYYSISAMKEKLVKLFQKRIFQMDYAHYMKQREKYKIREKG